MATLLTPTFSYYTQSKTLGFFDSCKLCFKGRDLVAMKIDQEHAAFVTATDEATELFKPSVDKTKAEELFGLDYNRDNKEKTVYFVSNGYAKHYNPDISAAGQAIVDCINKYGEAVYKQSYKDETFTLQRIYNDLTTEPALVEAVKTCHLETEVEEMNSDNILFKDTYYGRVMASKTEEDELNCAEKITFAIQTYKALEFKINAGVAFQPEVDYSDLIKELNLMIKDAEK